MHLRVLSSGSAGNATLIRAGETTVLVDAGLGLTELQERLDAARIGPGALDHVLVTHGHLDHARSAGAIARKHRATVHCSENLMRNRSIRRSKRLATIPILAPRELEGPAGPEGLAFTAVPIPHDADPTVAYRLEHAGRVAVVLTDMGVPRLEIARRLAGAHLIQIEFNHDPAMVAAGPYPAPLKRRILGNAGHLSNEQAAWMLRRLAGPELHTVVLSHLSETNNTPELAYSTAREALDELGLTTVELVIASQHRVGPSLRV